MKTLRQHLKWFIRVEFQLVTFAAQCQERFLARKMRIRTVKVFLGVECCATFQAALYIETHSMMHHSEFDAADVALSRAADKRKSLIYVVIKTGIPPP